MFWTPARLRFYLYRRPTDMRKSFDGLHGIVSTDAARDPLSGDVFVFVNKRRNRIKFLIWDGDGFWIFYKRLEKGTFQIPIDTAAEATSLEVSYDQLMMILQGIDLASVKRRSRYTRLPVVA